MMDAMKAHKALHNTEKTLLLPAKASATSWGRVAAAAVALACVSGLGVAARVARSQESLAVSTEAAATTGASSGVDGRDAAWAKFKGDFAKDYETEVHEARARNNFETRLEKLAAANAANGGVEVFGVTEHADREPGARAYARGRRARVPASERPASPSRVDLEPVEGASHAFVDWRADSRGVVSAVKNQGQCGSCWAFSATEQVESQLVLAGAPQVELSTQQVASCTADPQLMCCDGCAGGDPTAAYEYLAWASHKGGLAPDAWWPYEQGLTPDEVCEAPACTKTCDKDVSQLPADFGYVGPYAKVSGYAYAIPECDVGACDDQDTDQLAARLEASPLSVCLNAGAWDDYTGGVLSEAACGGHGADDVDHCVQLVGYNKTEPDNSYWIVRNSWSTSWGEDGYIYLSMDGNACGVANEATLAVVAEGDGDSGPVNNF